MTGRLPASSDPEETFATDRFPATPMSPACRRVGLLPAAVGFAISLAAVVSFRRRRTTEDPLELSGATYLVTGGVFRMTRNPMYLGLLLALSGWAIWLGSLSPLLVLPLFWLVITYAQIIPEEQALGKIFGEKYAVYCRQVNRWMGRRPQRP